MEKSKKILVAMAMLILIMITPIFSNASNEKQIVHKEFTQEIIKISSSDAIANPNVFKPGTVTQNDINAITDKANPIIGAIVTVGVIISAVTLCILGIKYMIGSVDERAEYKKSMMPYIIGSVLLFSASTIVGIIAELVKGLNA